MSSIDLSQFQQDTAGTTVTMPDGSEIVLAPLMALGSEHDDLLLDLIGQVSALSEGSDMDKVTKIMPVASKLIAAAAPNQKAAKALDRLPLMARFQILMGYIEDQDLGGFRPSEG